MRLALAALTAALVVALPSAPTLAQETIAKSNGVSTFGDLKYGADFAHFDYVNPDAPKGGTARYATVGTFDTLNPFQLKGNKAIGMGLTFDTLLASSGDEPDSAYGLLAESVEIPKDRTWVQFDLRKDARFHDGTPVTPEDVIWTFETLKEHGDPAYRIYYRDVMKAEKVGENGVRFTFRNGDNRELPLICGQLPVLSKKYWEGRDFEKTTLEAPLGSGPYQVDTVDTGRDISYRRVPDYWGKDLPVNRGRHNFDSIRYDYYRDRQIALEAFKAGQYDIREEFTAKNWKTGYDSPALRDGLFKMEEIPNKMPQGMQGFVFNLRDPKFQDLRVREAFDYLFDFEWTNKNLFYGEYKRTASYFPNTDLAATGLPTPEETKILEKYKGEIPDDVFTAAYEPPKTDGTGNIRDNLRQALRLLKEAGWSVKGERLVNGQTGQPFEFDFLVDEADFERILLPFKQNLARAGITMNLRSIDPAQYQNRLNKFDFEMTMVRFPSTLSPGNEERELWGSAAADQEGSNNIIGIKSKAVDGIIDLIIGAQSRAEQVTATHALDRVLLESHYLIPGWYQSSFHVAYWDKFGMPKVSPPYELATDTWWIDPARAQTVEAKKAQEPTK
ncbi:MAG TPA: extracellular solute-binding protein [Stellaceae bacterium]|nr:extracellular solute-binding protein [Stellaceae bacterium]